MKTILALFVFLAVACRSVSGTNCSDVTSRMCEATDFTLATCSETNVCDCKDSYGPIPSGCGKIFSQPEVSLPEGRTKKLINSKSGVLTCNTPGEASVSGSFEYAWFRDDTKVDQQTAKTHMVSEAGRYRCQIVAKETELESLNSEKSEALEITVLARGQDVADKPKIVASSVPSKADDGVEYTPICGNIPIGADSSFSDQDNTSVSTPITTDSSGSATEIKCTVETTAEVTFTNALSDLVHVPTAPDEIESATVEIAGSTDTSYNYKVDTENVEAKCVTVPAAEFLTASNLAYKFMVNGTEKGTEATYLIEIDSKGLQEVTCEVVYKSQPAKTSETVMVTVSDNFIEKPVVEASATKPVPKARLVLTCNAPGADMITWKQGNDLIQRQNDHILQFDDYSGAEQIFKCTATKGSFETESDGKTITPQGEIAKPSIDTTDSFYGENGNYNLTCQTDSATVGMSYEWKRDSETLSTKTSVYMIEDAKAADDGNYTCKAMFDNFSSDVSDKVSVEIEDPGLPCTTADQATVCAGDQYTGTCDKDDRCECADGFKQKGSACESHGVALVSSMLLVTVAAVVAKLI